jgi:putative nucleotidyltransferase with HDIG domain
MENSQLSIMNTIQTVDGSDYEKKQELFFEIESHLLIDESPSNYLNEISSRKIFHDSPFSMLNNLKETMQSPIHHPEGNAWNHTMLVVNEAARVKSKSNNPKVFLWAALLHDIGKTDTTRSRKGKITAYNHDTVGAFLAEEFLNYFNCDKKFTDCIVQLVRFHMHILYVLKDLPYGNVSEMKEKVDLKDLALLGLCDRLGRHNGNRKEEEDNMYLFLSKINYFERREKNHG